MAGTPAKDIALSLDRPERAVRSLSVSTSPTATFHSPPNSFGGQLTRTTTRPKQLKPFDKTDMKILLLENINQSGKEILSGQNYQVESLKTSLPEDQLIEKIRWGNFLVHSFEFDDIQLIEARQGRPRYRNSLKDETE
jgi:D-3-phosphoglycerate dehydrogenase